MNKRQINKKKEPSQKVLDISLLLERGNYYSARAMSRQCLLSTNATDEETDFARLALKKSFPDTYALLAGLLSLVFSIGTLFLSAYYF